MMQMLDTKMQPYAIYTGVFKNKTSAIGSRNRLPLNRKRHAPDISTRFKKNGSAMLPAMEPIPVAASSRKRLAAAAG